MKRDHFWCQPFLFSGVGGALACFGDDGDIDVRHLVGETAILIEPMVQRHPKHGSKKKSLEGLVGFLPFLYIPCYFFVMVPRTSLAGLQSTVNAFPCTEYKTEELD